MGELLHKQNVCYVLHVDSQCHFTGAAFGPLIIALLTDNYVSTCTYIIHYKPYWTMVM